MAYLRRSMSQVEETVVPWRVYPRADYFKNRFISVYQRVNNFLNEETLIDVFDRFYMMHSASVLDEMHREFIQFSSDIKVVVYSETELGNETYVTDTRPMENWKSDASKDEEHSLNVYIQHLKSPENPALGWEKEVVPVMSAPPVNGPLFIAVDFDDHMSPVQREEFLKAVKKTSKIEETRICMVNDKVLSMRIEEYLEDQIMATFSKLSNYLNDPLLSTPLYEDMLYYLYSLIRRYCKSPDVDALIKFSLELEDRLARTFDMRHSASRNLLEEIGLKDLWYRKRLDEPDHFARVVYDRLKEKLETIYKRQEETLRKFDFEIHRYLQQTRIQGYEPKLTPTTVVKVSEEMRSELLALENVYAVATVFGEFRIHLYDKELHSDKTTLIVDEEASGAVSSAHVEGNPGLTDVAGDTEAIETKVADMKLTFPTSIHKPVKMPREDRRFMSVPYLAGDTEAIETKVADMRRTFPKSKPVKMPSGARVFMRDTEAIETKVADTKLTFPKSKPVKMPSGVRVFMRDTEAIETKVADTKLTFPTSKPVKMPSGVRVFMRDTEAIETKVADTKLTFPKSKPVKMASVVRVFMRDTEAIETKVADTKLTFPTSKPVKMPSGVRVFMRDTEAIETKVADTKPITFPMSIHKPVKMPREDRRLMTDARKAINAILSSHNFNSPYSVKVISSLPTQYFDSGKEILCPSVNDPGTLMRGTLGGFMDLTGQDNRTSLYGLTCAHVVNTIDDFNVFVISEERDEQMLFATSSPRMTIGQGSNRDFPFVDFAAIKVVEPVSQDCTRMLKDIDGNYWPYEVFNGRGQDSAVGRCVHKYGATTNLTEGIVASTDMIISGTGEQYLVLVEPLPGSSTTEKFSDHGDSGAITCMMEPGKPNNHTTITALSMVSGGDMTFEGEELPYTLSFMLQTGLDLLNEQLAANIPQ